MTRATTSSNRKGKWTEEEDRALFTAIEKCKQLGEDDLGLVFAEVAKFVPGRNPKQVQERWENVSKPGLKKGAWDDDEAKLLLQEIARKGQEWSLIKDSFSNRGFHSIKVKGRWLLGEIRNRKSSKSHPIAKGVEWDQREIMELFQLHREFGYDVEEIARRLPMIRPVAQVERTLLKHCHCSSCCLTRHKIMSKHKDFKTGWSMAKAEALLIQMESEKQLVEPTLKGKRKIYIPEAELEQGRKSPRTDQCEEGRKFIGLVMDLVEETGCESLKKIFRSPCDDVKDHLFTSLGYAGSSMVSYSSVLYQLNLKLSAKNRDPRYNELFIFPPREEQQTFFFSPEKPVGSMIFKTGDPVCVEADANAISMLGKVKDRHLFDICDSAVHGFFSKTLSHRTLVERGEVWMRQIFRDSRGVAQVFLVHQQNGYFGPNHCRVRFQNVSGFHPEILNLPPEL